MEALENLASKIRVCKLCDLSTKRKIAVPGEGPNASKLFIVGEAPGRFEDEQGKPFVGMSGRFLNRYLELAGLNRSDTFVTNAVKCRPPNNRKPDEFEIITCRPYLIEQISLVKPKIILALGTSAASSIGMKFEHISEIRGRLMEVSLSSINLKVFVTYHPSFPMRFKKPRPIFLEDLKEVRRILNA